MYHVTPDDVAHDFLQEARVRPAVLRAASSWQADDATLRHWKQVHHGEDTYLVLRDDTLATRWGEDAGRRRTLVVEEFPWCVASRFTDGVASYFEHLHFTMVDLDEDGCVTRLRTRRFGETAEATPDVLRQAAVVMASLEVAGA